MKNKFKIWIALLIVLLIVSCIWDDDYKTLPVPKNAKTHMSDKDIKVFKSTNSEIDTLFVKIDSYENAFHIEKEYHEEYVIYYLDTYIDHFISPYEKMEAFFIHQNYELLNIQKMTKFDLDGVFIDGVYYADENKNIITDFSSYHQNGHIYPDVYTFEMDTASAMEDWDTTMNLFPDVRKVWYSLSQGIVRYDMKDGESFRLIEK